MQSNFYYIMHVGVCVYMHIHTHICKYFTYTIYIHCVFYKPQISSNRKFDIIRSYWRKFKKINYTFVIHTFLKIISGACLLYTHLILQHKVILRTLNQVYQPPFLHCILHSYAYFSLTQVNFFLPSHSEFFFSSQYSENSVYFPELSITPWIRWWLHIPLSLREMTVFSSSICSTLLSVQRDVSREFILKWHLLYFYFSQLRLL